MVRLIHSTTHAAALRLRTGLALATLLCMSTAASTQVPVASDVPASSLSSGFETYKAYLQQRARSERISDQTIRLHIPPLRLSERAISLDRAQRPASSQASTRSGPLTPYLRQHVSKSLIWRGQERYHHHWPALYRVQSTYGVDAPTLLAIFGKETSYGTVTGNFDLLEALASLAYEGRRRQLFETEFLAALKLIDTGVSRHRLVGSYAGATGFPQFMPTAVLRLRADGDGDGYSDIWTNEVDALASIANYLRDAGWKPGLPWGAQAHVPTTLNRTAVQRASDAVGCSAIKRHSRALPIARWRELGVSTVGNTLPDKVEAALLEPFGPEEKVYLVTQNFLAVLSYNCSNAYAMSVVVLSDAIARR